MFICFGTGSEAFVFVHASHYTGLHLNPLFAVEKASIWRLNVASYWPDYVGQSAVL